MGTSTGYVISGMELSVTSSIDWFYNLFAPNVPAIADAGKLAFVFIIAFIIGKYVIGLFSHKDSK